MSEIKKELRELFQSMKKKIIERGEYKSTDFQLIDSLMSEFDAVSACESLTSQLEALKKENEELKKERDLWRHNLNKYVPNKKYQEVLDEVTKLRGRK